jgi:hypothetical protein
MFYKLVIHTPANDTFIQHIGTNRHSFYIGRYNTKKEALKEANILMKKSKKFEEGPISYEIIMEIS